MMTSRENDLYINLVIIIMIVFPAGHMSGLEALVVGLDLHPSVASDLFLSS